MWETNAGSFINFRIWGPSKIPALTFSQLVAGNLLRMYRKQSAFLSSAYTNCFIRPKFDMQRWEEDYITINQRLIYHIVLLHHEFFTYGTILTLSWSPALLSHRQRKHGYSHHHLAVPIKGLPFSNRHISTTYARCSTASATPFLQPSSSLSKLLNGQ